MTITNAPPAAPTALTAAVIPVGSNYRVDLAWSASAGPNVGGYKVYRKTGTAGTYAEVATVSGTAWSDTTVAKNTTYFYTVKASNVWGGGLSALSNEAKAVIPKR